VKKAFILQHGKGQDSDAENVSTSKSSLKSSGSSRKPKKISSKKEKKRR